MWVGARITGGVDRRPLRRPHHHMVMQVTCRFEATAAGSRLTGTSQVVDLTGGDVTEEQTAGWNMMLQSFAADLAANPLPT